MSAKEAPQKNLYFRFGSVWRAVVVLVDRRRKRAERFSAPIIIFMSCVYVVV